MNKYLEKAGNIHLSYYIEAAEKLGIKYDIVVKGLIAKFYINNHHTYIINTVTPINSIPSGTISKRKYLTNFILNKAGIPVPKQEILEDVNSAISFHKQYKNIVIKPTQAIGGHGISILPLDIDEVKSAYNFAYINSKSKEKYKVLGEEFIEGDNYRILVLDKEVIGVVRRIPAFVTGDRSLKIIDLIKKNNIERKNKGLKEILTDKECEICLSRKQLTLQSVPSNNETVYLRFNSNLTTGGTTQECSNEMNNFYKDLAIKAVKEVGLKLGGVDLIAKDISKPDKCAINEINYNPGLRPHYKPDKGEIVEVAIPIMKYIINFICQNNEG